MSNENTLYKTLYKLNTNGSTQVWHIHRNENSYWSVSGKLDGKMTVNAPTLCEPKQKRTQEQQVVAVCESQIEKKRRKKYVEDINDIHSANDNLLGFEAMLAHKYEGNNKKKITFPCIAQPKLDGIRNLSTSDGFFSRGRKEFTSCTHIKAELEGFFKANPQARLDGELYTHEFKEDFEKICKAVKKSAEKATATDLVLQEKIQYWVYDTPRIASFTEQDKFVDRQAELAKTFKDYKYVKVVETVIVQNEEELLALKAKWIQDGWEGIMVRQMDAPYEAKRSYTLQKLKDFIDEEFLIVAINEGQGKLAGHAGSFTFALHDNEADAFIAGLDTNVQKFDAKMIGSIDRLKDLFENPEKALGKTATVRYQNRSADDIPRFPVCRGIRDYE